MGLNRQDDLTRLIQEKRAKAARTSQAVASQPPASDERAAPRERARTARAVRRQAGPVDAGGRSRGRRSRHEQPSTRASGAGAQGQAGQGQGGRDSTPSRRRRRISGSGIEQTMSLWEYDNRVFQQTRIDFSKWHDLRAHFDTRKNVSGGTASYTDPRPQRLGCARESCYRHRPSPGLSRLESGYPSYRRWRNAPDWIRLLELDQRGSRRHPAAAQECRSPTSHLHRIGNLVPATRGRANSSHGWRRARQTGRPHPVGGCVK